VRSSLFLDHNWPALTFPEDCDMFGKPDGSIETLQENAWMVRDVEGSSRGDISREKSRQGQSRPAVH
jgi:hypothetical protein